jgi:hypothetical protein
MMDTPFRRVVVRSSSIYEHKREQFLFMTKQPLPQGTTGMGCGSDVLQSQLMTLGHEPLLCYSASRAARVGDG